LTDPDSTNPHNLSPSGDTTFITSISGTKRTYLPGDIVDNLYQLTAQLGLGGMGVVFSCKHLLMDREYAIKILSGEQLSEEYWQRFRAEAQALAKLNHQNIVGVHNMGVDAGQFPYFVMDLIEGQPLDVVLRKEGRLAADEAMDIFLQIAEALSAAHAQEIIHRDVKPSNIMLVRDSRSTSPVVKIVDFGIARLSKRGLSAQSQTKTGMVFGTPFYMSPEQCQGEKVDERSDIYSLGCALFECLTGRPPFCGANQFQTFMLHQTQPPPSLTDAAPNENFPAGLEAAMAKMLAKNVTNRYQTMGQVKQDFERIRAGKIIMAQSTLNRSGSLPRKAPIDTPTAKIEESGQDAKSSKDSIPSKDSNNSKGSNKSKHSHIAKGADAKNSNVAMDAGDEDLPPGSSDFPPLKVALLALIAFSVCAAAAFSFYLFFNTPKSAALLQASKFKTRFGDDEDFKDAATFIEIKEEAPILEKRLQAYKSDPVTSHAALKQDNPPGFLFPKDFILGAINIGDGIPVLAAGFIPCPPGARVTLYLTKYAEHWPEFLEKFGADDINALEIKTDSPQAVIKEVKKWHKLDELIFFNSLLKAVPDKDETKRKDTDNEATSDESALTDKDLDQIDQLTNIKTLGLCGVNVDGEAITKMHLFKTISGLKLKRVNNLKKLLDALPARDNLKELWLVAQDITDVQLEPLTHMKNLETLRIRRSKLTPASIDYFKRMPALKQLCLDHNWLPQDAEQFQKIVQLYQYEPMTDRHYWKLIPDHK
jgi:serine/threonine protein kinase